MTSPPSRDQWKRLYARSANLCFIELRAQGRACAPRAPRLGGGFAGLAGTILPIEPILDSGRRPGRPGRNVIRALLLILSGNQNYTISTPKMGGAVPGALKCGFRQYGRPCTAVPGGGSQRYRRYSFSGGAPSIARPERRGPRMVFAKRTHFRSIKNQPLTNNQPARAPETAAKSGQKRPEAAKSGQKWPNRAKPISAPHSSLGYSFATFVAFARRPLAPARTPGTGDKRC